MDAPNSSRNDDAVADRELEVRAESGLHPFPAGRRVLGGVGEPVEEPAAGVVEELDVQRTLAREVLVENGLGDPGGLGDVVHRGVVEAGAREEVARDREQLLATFVRQEDASGVRRSTSAA